MQYNQGIAVVEANDLSCLLKQFQDSQSVLLQDSHRQIAWTRRWAITVMLIFLTMVAIAIPVYYRYFEKQSSVKIAQKIEQANEAAYALEQRLMRYQDLSRQEMGKMRRENQRAGQSFADYIAKSERQRQSMLQEYERKTLALEKEKLLLENSRQELRKSCTRAELSLIEADREIKSLKKQIANLQKESANYQRQVEHWKKIAAEKFSPEQWSALQQDLKKDD